MINCQFIFEFKGADDDYIRLDAAIDNFARSLDGFISTEIWYSEDRSLKNASYFFHSMDAVRQLAAFPQHLEAKRENQRWYDGYQIVVSEVTASYGNGRIGHVTDQTTGNDR